MNYPKKNIEIALFMGHNIEGGMVISKSKKRTIRTSPGYHANWKMLIPVCIRLKEILKEAGQYQMNDRIQVSRIRADRKECYDACYDAIKWLTNR